MKKPKTKQPKKTYQKPTLRTIELVTDEVLSLGCKTLTGSGVTGLCIANNCFEQGS